MGIIRAKTPDELPPVLDEPPHEPMARKPGLSTNQSTNPWLAAPALQTLLLLRSGPEFPSSRAWVCGDRGLVTPTLSALMSLSTFSTSCWSSNPLSPR
ncbi:hypothetical protein CRG98_027643 [Punica granatum]|uniref:Uncharacterized protein n=1 Tax=Punica granatum TaxID=22663 RepID=A0A2I0J6X2_PUNGR|nr:hypothetical protein CRG98_027643 [Punica granatum]